MTEHFSLTRHLWLSTQSELGVPHPLALVLTSKVHTLDIGELKVSNHAKKNLFFFFPLSVTMLNSLRRKILHILGSGPPSLREKKNGLH